MGPQLTGHSGPGKPPLLVALRCCVCFSFLSCAVLFMSLCTCAPQGRHKIAISLPVEEPWRWPSLAVPGVACLQPLKGACSPRPGQSLPLVTFSSTGSGVDM